MAFKSNLHRNTHTFLRFHDRNERSRRWAEWTHGRNVCTKDHQQRLTLNAFPVWLICMRPLATTRLSNRSSYRYILIIIILSRFYASWFESLKYLSHALFLQSWLWYNFPLWPVREWEVLLETKSLMDLTELECVCRFHDVCNECCLDSLEQFNSWRKADQNFRNGSLYNRV